MEEGGELNLYDVPLMALRHSTRQLIINELNKKKVLASEEGLPRDWRGLAHLTGLREPPGDSPCSQLLTAWERESAASLGLLLQYLGQLDRWDIVDDVQQLVKIDAKEFCEKMSQSSTSNVPAANWETDERVLTFDDMARLEHGLQLQMYDALLLYADQDKDLAQQMVDRLENDYCLKLCLKENLVGGLSFEHQAVMRLISERCRRVIIIVSRSFVNSPVNQFFVTFAQALAIEQRRRIIIPCMYERDHIDLPMEINYLHKLDYNRVGLRHYDFWELLRASVTSTTVLPRHPPVMIREVNSSSVSTSWRAIKPAEATVPSRRDLSQDFCSNSLSPNAQEELIQKFSCSSLSLAEKSHKSKSPSKFLRKLFRSEANKEEKKQSKKVAVRL